MIRRYLLLAWALALTVAGLVMNVVRPDEVTGLVLPAALMAILGAVLRMRVPGNPVPGALVGGGSAWLVYDVARRYATLGDVPGDYVAAWLGSWTGALLPLSLAALLIVYPGGIRNRVGWVVAIALVALAASAGVGAILLWGVPVEVLTNSDTLNLRSEYRPVDAAFLLGFFSTIPAMWSLALRFRRGTQLERQQIKVLLAAAAVFGVVFAILGFIGVGEQAFARSWIAGGAMSLLPIAVAVAIVRYRLYDIDRLVSRTVSWALVTGLLVAVYAGTVVVLSGLARSLTRAETSTAAVAASTLLVAALFGPVRRRVQTLVDRRFNRARYDALRTVEEFGAAVRSSPDPAAAGEQLVAAVAGSLQPARVQLALREDPA